MGEIESKIEFIEFEEFRSHNVGLLIINIVTCSIPTIFMAIFFIFVKGKHNWFVSLFKKWVFLFLILTLYVPDWQWQSYIKLMVWHLWYWNKTTDCNHKSSCHFIKKDGIHLYQFYDTHSKDCHIKILNLL